MLNMKHLKIFVQMLLAASWQKTLNHHTLCFLVIGPELINNLSLFKRKLHRSCSIQTAGTTDSALEWYLHIMGEPLHNEKEWCFILGQKNSIVYAVFLWEAWLWLVRISILPADVKLAGWGKPQRLKCPLLITEKTRIDTCLNLQS